MILGWCFGCACEVEWDPLGHVTGHGYIRPHDGSISDRRLTYRCSGPVWPGVRVHDQAELEAKVPGLLRIKAPGHWLEWVPGRGRLELYSVALDADTKLELLTGHLWTREHGYLPEPDRPPIKWLRIVADPDGPPVDLADVRAVVAQARGAGVPVWIERLGTICGNQYFDGLHPAEWPEDLQICRELPEATGRER